MLFNSFVFILFLIVILPVFYSLSPRYKNFFLVLASYFFYGYWDWRFCFLLLISTIVDYVIGLAIYNSDDKSKRKSLLLTSITINLSILGVFKYYGFFIESLTPLATIFGGNLDYLHLNIILPVGISFYTFQTMSYTIDIYKGEMKPTTSFIDFALFVSFFPQLVAGPIERAKNLLPQLSSIKKPTQTQISKGICLVVLGMFKKVMIGDTCGRIVDHIFAQQELYFSDELLAALILFSIQIYADFSGYSSIARGVAKLLGIELMKNFEQPYLSSNITEFWRRWHISLSSWLKDYLYIPLGGNRKGKVRTYINLMLTMLLGGLWHGASWTFVVWGGLHGIYLSIHKFFLGNKKPAFEYKYHKFNDFIIYLFKTFSTYVLVLFTWLFFREKSFSDAVYFIDKMINWEFGEFTSRFLTITLSFMVVVLFFDFFEYKTKSHTFLLNIKPHGIYYGIATALLFLTLLFLFQNQPLPFVYFQF